MTRLLPLLVLICLMIGASLGLYHTSNRTQELSEQLKRVNASIEDERRSLHVLNAEWAYLASPERLDAAARKHSELRPTAPKQVASLSDIAHVIPVRGPAVVVASTVVPVPVTERVAEEVKTTLAVASMDDSYERNPVLLVRADVRDGDREGAHGEISGDQIGDLIHQLGSHP